MSSIELGYPLIICYVAIEAMAHGKCVDLPSYKMVIVHSYVNIYQRVQLMEPRFLYIPIGNNDGKQWE